MSFKFFPPKFQNHHTPSQKGRGDMNARNADDTRAFLAQLWKYKPPDNKRGRAPMVPLPTPSSIMLHDEATIRSNRYLVAPKNDGVRALLVIGIRPVEQENKCFANFVYRNGHVEDVPQISFVEGNEIEQGTVLDGELMVDPVSRARTFIVFDCVAVFGSGGGVKELTLPQRLQWADLAVLRLQCPGNTKVVVKSFVDSKTHPDVARSMITDRLDACDGVILAPVHEHIGIGCQAKYFKYKPLDLITIDVLWDPVSATLQCTIEDGSLHQVEEILQDIRWDAHDFATYASNLVECYVHRDPSDARLFQLKPKMIRRDKKSPNSAFVIRRTCQNVRENIKPEQLCEWLSC